MPRFINEAYKHVGRGTKAEPALVAGMLVCPQKNSWGCGPWALRHCFMKWGFDFDPYCIARLAGTKRSGTDEHGMKLAATLLGSEYRFIDVDSAVEAKRQVDKMLTKSMSIVLCVDGFNHWIACLHRSRRGYLVFDSGGNSSGPVIQLQSWQKLKKRLKYVDKHGTTHYFISGMKKPRSLL